MSQGKEEGSGEWEEHVKIHPLHIPQKVQEQTATGISTERGNKGKGMCEECGILN